jgi:hypothetical protein
MTPHKSEPKAFYDRRIFKIALAIIGLFGGISITTVLMTAQRLGGIAIIPFIAPYVHSEIFIHSLQEKVARDSSIRSANDSTKVYIRNVVQEGNDAIADKLDHIPVIHASIDSADKIELQKYRRSKQVRKFFHTP